MAENWSSAQKLRYQIKYLKGDRQAVRQVLMISSIDDTVTSIQSGTAVAE